MSTEAGKGDRWRRTNFRRYWNAPYWRSTEDKEQIYDNEIAPEIMKLAERCQDRGMSLFAAVDYGSNEEALGITAGPNKNSGLQWKLISWAAGCKGNVDLLIGQILKHAEEHGHSSAYVELLQSITDHKPL